VAVCDDRDLCTQDACVAGRCVHDQASGFPAVLCRLDGISAALQGAPATAAGGSRSQHKLEKSIARARGFTVAGQGAQGRRRVKQLGRASNKLTAFVTQVQRGLRLHKIDPGLGARLLGLASSAMSELTPLRTPG
jgi:hypothetical protein